MTLFDYLHSAFSQIKRNLLRSILTILGIVIGVCAITTVISIGEAGQNSVYGELEKFGINRLFIYPYDAVYQNVLKREDIDYLEKMIEKIDQISPQSFYSGKATYRSKSKSVDIVATTPVLKSVENKTMASGRFLNDTDVDYARNVIVLSQDAKDALFGKQSAIGESVEVDGKSFTVIGVEENTKPLYTSVVAAKSYIPISTYEKIFQNSSIGEISITVANADDMEGVTEDAVSILLNKYGDNSIKIMNLADEAKNADNIMNIFKLVIGAIALISLFVGGIGIMNIMLVTVRERTKEIGVRKALGAKDSVILKQFLMEAVMYTLVGSAIGLLLGVGLTFLAESMIGLEGRLSIAAMIGSVVFSAIVGILFGIIPAYKAAKMDPALALRHN